MIAYYNLKIKKRSFFISIFVKEAQIDKFYYTIKVERQKQGAQVEGIIHSPPLIACNCHFYSLIERLG